MATNAISGRSTAPISLGFSVALLMCLAASLMILAGGPPLLVVVAIIAAAVAALAMRYPLIAIACLVVVTVGNISDNLIQNFGAPSIAKIIAPGLVGLLALRWAFRGERPFVHLGCLFLLTGFLLIEFSGLLHAADWSESVGVASEAAKEMIIATLALGFMNRPGAFETLTWSSLITASALCALGVVLVATGSTGEEFRGFAALPANDARFSGPMSDPNFWGAVLVFMVPLGFHATLTPRSPWSKAFGAVLLALILFGLVMTKSRGDLIAAMMAICFLLLFLERRQVLWVFVIGAIATAIIGLSLSDAILERFATILSASEGNVPDPSVEGRLASWAVARQLFFDHPIFGVGPGNFNVHYQAYALNLGLIFRGEDRSAHSLYLEYLAETGLVGLTWYIAIVVSAVGGAVRATLKARAAGERLLASRYAAFGAGLTGYMGAMLFLHDSFPRFPWLILVVGIALPKIAELTLQRRQAAIQPPPETARLAHRAGST